MISKSVIIGDHVQIGQGVVVDANCILGTYSRIFHNCVLRNNVFLGVRVIIGHLVVIESYTQIGDDTTIQSQCHITRGARIGRKVFIGPMAMCINESNIASHGRNIRQNLRGPIIGDGARIGAGVRIAPGVQIGQEAFIAMGSYVTKDIPPFQYWRGIPARYVRDIPEEERLEWN